MSGIYGFFTNQSTELTEMNIAGVRAWNHSYGWDGENEYRSPKAYMGIFHESISKYSQGRFFVDEKDFCATIDAVIYNRGELIERYEKDCAISNEHSDEEIVFQLMKSKGCEALKDVNGDFAGAVYDKSRKQVTLFRDHMGVRPIFYYLKDGRLAFSSDIRGLCALSFVDSSVSEDWIYEKFIGLESSDAERTIYEYIHTVKPGGYVTVQIGNPCEIVGKECYWSFSKNKRKYADEQDYINELRRLIEDAVRIRLDVCPSRVGAELSGGLDSGVIDILIHRMQRECTYVSWTVNPTDYPLIDGDERKIIQDICEQEQIDCKFIDANLNSDCNGQIAQNMEKSGLILKDDFYREAFPYYINTDYISGTAKLLHDEGVKVCFTGHGGDEGVSHRCNEFELFYQYEYMKYIKQMWLQTQGRKLRLLRTGKRILVNLTKTRKEILGDAKDYLGVPELVRAEFANKYKNRQPYLFTFAFDPKKYIEDGWTVNRLLNVALQGAYNGVRYMVPYLDYRVIDFALSIPRYMYLRGKENRYIFREAFRDIMPKSLYEQKAKEDRSFRTIHMKENEKSSENGKENIQVAEHIKKETLETLSKVNVDFWNRYLDFEKLDEWLDAFSLDEDKSEMNYKYDMCLFECARIDQMAVRARSYVSAEKR